MRAHGWWRRPSTYRSTWGRSRGRWSRCATSSRGRSARATCTSDRKSTRLNSSHLVISYAVFCLKKKHSLPLPYATRYPHHDHISHDESSDLIPQIIFHRERRLTPEMDLVHGRCAFDYHYSRCS